MKFDLFYTVFSFQRILYTQLSISNDDRSGIPEYLFVICFQAVVRKDAELAQFLLFLQEELTMFERSYCSNFPSRDEYVKEVGKLRQIFPTQISNDVHFRKWLWMLLTVDATQCHCIGHLRAALKNDTKEFLRFAKHIEVLYSVLCEDVHGKSPLEIRHIQKNKYSEYIQFFATEVRESIRIFLQSQEKP